MKTCSCGATFAPSSNRQKRCNRCRFRGGAPKPGTTHGTRRCALCGRSFVARAPNQRFCTPEHAWRANRPKRAARYSDPRHRRLRRALEPEVAAGRTRCARCGELILPGEAWDLDHHDSGIGYLGPSHARCNRATSRHAKERRQREGRTW